MIKQVFPPDQLGKAFAAFGPAMGLSAVAGPILSGALVDADLFGTGWRMIFLVNVPVVVAARLACGTGAAADGRDRPGRRGGHERDGGEQGHERDGGQRRGGAAALGWRDRIDPGGMLLVTAMAALVYPLVEGRERGWPWWIFAILASAWRCSGCSPRTSAVAATPP